MQYENTMCCGVDEADGLNKAGTPRQAMKEFIVRYIVMEEECAHVIFTEARRTKKSKSILTPSWWGKLSAYIKRHSLGQITSSPWKINPNTKNSVRVHVVTPNIPALKKLFAKEIEEEKIRYKKEMEYWGRWR